MDKDQEETLVEAALRVLNTADPFEKARLGDEVANRWLQGEIKKPYYPSVQLAVPDRPSRLSDVSPFESVHLSLVTSRRNASKYLLLFLIDLMIVMLLIGYPWFSGCSNEIYAKRVVVILYR